MEEQQSAVELVLLPQKINYSCEEGGVQAGYQFMGTFQLTFERLCEGHSFFSRFYWTHPPGPGVTQVGKGQHCSGVYRQLMHFAPTLPPPAAWHRMSTR